MTTALDAPSGGIAPTVPTSAEHSTAALSADPATSTTPLPLSKNAQKKAAKAERYAEIKLERRAREKEARKQKRVERAAKRAAGELDSADEAVEEAARRTKRARTSGPKEYFGARVVVDLGFDEKMTDKEVHSLTGQLSYVYAANRRADKAFQSILYTGLTGRTKERLDATNEAAYKRWANCEWWEEGYEHLWRAEPEESPVILSNNVDNTPVPAEEDQDPLEDGRSSSSPTTNKPAERSRTARSNVVYLTADTDEELTELLPHETYILGGIVDRNRYKNLCLEKAKQTGVRVARLPIGKYMSEMQTRKVLTVNQVFEILLKWLETRDWEVSLRSVMPKRKLPSAAESDKTDEAKRIAPLLSAEGGVDLSVEPAPGDKNELDEEGEGEHSDDVSVHPAMQLPRTDVVESTIEIDNVRT